jgi:hypothetical protein
VLTQAMSADRSCQNIVNQAALQRLAEGFSTNSTHTGGYCLARQRLPLTMVSSLTQQLGELIDEQVPNAWRWRGRRVRIVDGTTLTMPDTPANQAAFPQQRGQQPGLGFPICRLVGITRKHRGQVSHFTLCGSRMGDLGRNRSRALLSPGFLVPLGFSKLCVSCLECKRHTMC